ncbi:phage head-tail family partial [Stylonychia lemnae]|uniref:Phage head-tail family partial n=1 Tax=Stylonychia lemnae TaxID=5949 RepID=A0A077ZPE3_STYLE|nr:phage head-tail family partial [Stylonychia lemnae]
MKMAERMEMNKILQDQKEDTDNKFTSNNTEENQNQLNMLKQQKDPITQFLRQVPPDISKAEIHGQANQVVNLEKINFDLQNPDSFCICCGLPIPAGSEYPLCSDLKDLKSLGAGYPMYYALKKNFAWLLFILSILCGIPCSIIAGVQILKNRGYTSDYYPYMSKVSIGNVFLIKELFDDDNLILLADIILYLNAVGIIYLLIHSIYLRRMLIKLNQELDEDQISPSDFTLIARHLPQNITQDQLKAKFENQYSKYNIKVAYVNYAYNIEKMCQCNKQDLMSNKTIAVPPLRIKTGLCKSETITLEQINKQIQEVSDQMTEFDANLAPGTKEELYIGTAFIILESQKDLQLMINLQDDSLFSLIFSWINHLFCSCCQNKENVSRNNRFERAPEPTDVYWDNLSVSFFRRVRYIFLTYIATILLIGACFGIIYGINKGKDKLNDQQDSIPYSTIRFLSILCSFIVVFINICLRGVVRAFSQMERHETYTAYNLSVAFKLTLARFINTSIVPIVVNISVNRWFVDGGLISDIFYIMISISFLDPLLYLFDVFYLIRVIKRFFARRAGANSVLTQEDANNLWEGPPLDMANRYSNTANLFLTAVFFHPLLPVSIPIALCGCFFSYWIDKTLLLRRHKLPEQMSGLMAKFIANLLPYFAFLWSLNLLLFYRTLYKDFYKGETQGKLIVPYAIIATCSLFILLPVRTLINKCLENLGEQPTSEKYNDFYSKFPTDYDRENPVTKNEAFVRLLEHKMLTEKSAEAQDQLQRHKQNIANASLFDAIRNYTNKKEAQIIAMQKQHITPIQQVGGFMGGFSQSMHHRVSGGHHHRPTVMRHSHDYSKADYKRGITAFQYQQQYNASQYQQNVNYAANYYDPYSQLGFYNYGYNQNPQTYANQYQQAYQNQGQQYGNGGSIVSYPNSFIDKYPNAKKGRVIDDPIRNAGSNVSHGSKKNTHKSKHSSSSDSSDDGKHKNHGNNVHTGKKVKNKKDGINSSLNGPANVNQSAQQLYPQVQTQFENTNFNQGYNPSVVQNPSLYQQQLPAGYVDQQNQQNYNQQYPQYNQSINQQQQQQYQQQYPGTYPQVQQYPPNQGYY